MALQAIPGLHFAHVGGSSLTVLAGPPVSVSGEAWLVNDGPDPVTVGQADVTADVPAVEGRPRREPAVVAWTPVVVPGGDTARVRLSVALDRFTPPGTYEGHVVLGGVREPLVLEVTEDVRLTLAPGEILVDGQADVDQEKDLVITNGGNVPVPVSHLGPVPLGVDRPKRTLLQRLGVVARPPTGPVPGPDDEEKPPAVTARLAEPVEVAPGEVRRVRLAVTVTGSLEPGLRYRGTAALSTADLSFVVTPHQEPPAPATRAPRARTTTPAASKRTRPAQPSKAPATADKPDKRRSRS